MSSPPNPKDSGVLIESRLEVLKRKLLDLGLRNKLLNYKHSERGKTYLRVVDKLPQVMCERLVDGRSFSFASVPYPDQYPEDEVTPEFKRALAQKLQEERYVTELAAEKSTATRRYVIDRRARDEVRVDQQMPPYTKPTATQRARALGISVDPELPLPTAKSPRKQTDDSIQTLHYDDELTARLAKLRDSARTLNEDAGIEALYCAFGFLEWYQSPAEVEPHYAPLVFVPVTLARELREGMYVYEMRARDDEIETNITLAQKLRQDYSAELPDCKDAATLEDYFRAAEGLIQKVDPRWRVRRQVTLGLFTFAKLALYKDLTSTEWPNASLLTQHEVVRALIGSSDRTDGSIHALDEHVDTPVMEGLVRVLVTDADVSQQNAIADVMRGKNLVIQGPPGTGKSQTITNIIAAAMERGKTVLFVAEKMAALDVVKKRLDDFGLGTFCLELHAAKTKKAAVHNVFRARMEPTQRHGRARADALAAERAAARDRITSYASLVNSLAGETGSTYQQLAWRYLAASDVSHGTQALQLLNALIITDSDHRKAMGLAHRLAELHDKAGATRALWRGVGSRSLNKLQEDKVRETLNAWRTAASCLNSAIDAYVSECAWTTARTKAAAQQRVADISRVPRPSSDVDLNMLAELADTETRHALRDYVELRKRADAAVAYLSSKIRLNAVNREALYQAIQTATQLEVQSLDGEQMATRVTNDGRRVEAWQRAVEFKSSLSLFLRVTLHSAREVQRAFDLVQYVVSCERTILLWRIPSLLADDARPEVFALQQRAKKLRVRRDAIARQTRIDSLPESQILRAAAQTLRVTGLWGRLFSADYKNARGVHRGLHQRPNNDRHVMAADLDALASYRDDEAAFVDDLSLLKYAAKHAAGLDTEFEKLSELVDWADTIRAKTDSGDELDSALRARFFEISLSDIDKLQRLLAHPSFKDADAALTFLEKRPRNSFEDVAMQIDKRLQQGRVLLSLLQHAGVDPKVPFRELANIETALAELDALRVQRHSLETTNAEDCALLRHCDAASANAVAATADYAHALHEGVVPAPVVRWVRRVSLVSALRRLSDHARTLSEAVAALNTAEEAAVDLLRLQRDVWLGSDEPNTMELRAVVDHIGSALNALGGLWVACELGRVVEDARSTALAPVVQALESRGFQSAAASFELAFCRSALEQLHEQHPQLGEFFAPTLDNLRGQFALADKRLIEAHREVVAATVEARPVPSGSGRGRVVEYTEGALITHELGKQSRLLALRPLFARAGRAAQALTPCFMMSPMSVAQYLQPGGITFDLVVIDEASQMRPEDALGAIARGRQLVVVGDSKQLPPTSFFSAFTDDGEQENDDPTEGAESVLDLAARAFTPARQLRWHYRSRHESLIAFSNRAFYDQRLVVCPSSRPAGVNDGVSLETVDGLYAGNVNHDEAQAMLRALESHVEAHPEQSLALVTLNQPQRDLVQDLLDELCRKNPTVEVFRASRETTLEPLVVKNLENVQGDERDVIFVSTVFGRTADNKFRMNFGPLNRDNGERRLNVLFTRAKHRLRVFTSIPFEQIPDDARNGVLVLRDYLRFAQDPSRYARADYAAETDSPFEKWFAERLSGHGYSVQPQLGVAGFRIDLAVGHPSRPNEFILALECDGATYHASKSARDRDRLRDKSLHDLGWKTYRIWSTDWIQNPERELTRLLDRLARIIGERRAPAANIEGPSHAESVVLVEEALADIRDPLLRDFVTQLVRHGAGTPQIPYEHIDSRNGADLALEVGWPERRIAIAMPEEASAADRLRALGWKVWMADETLDSHAISLELGLS